MGSRSRFRLAPGASSPSQHLLMELKQQILMNLGKLSDRDTQVSAVRELERIALDMPFEGIPIYLVCLYDTDSKQKSSARKECIRMFGVLATFHGDLLIPHLSKIMTAIVRRFRDTDSGIGEACAAAVGAMAANIGGNEGSNGSPEQQPVIGFFLKPLMEALNEQARNVQVAAALCLDQVLQTTREPLDDSIPRLLPRWLKCLSRPSFSAKPQLISTIGTLTEVTGGAMTEHLPTLIPGLQDMLKSPDWLTRKAAIETLAHLIGSLGVAPLMPYKAGVIRALENCRSDKVKPVRGIAVEAIQLWEEVPGPSTPKKPTLTPKRGLPERPGSGSLSANSPRSASKLTSGTVAPSPSSNAFKKAATPRGDPPLNPNPFKNSEVASPRMPQMMSLLQTPPSVSEPPQAPVQSQASGAISKARRSSVGQLQAGQVADAVQSTTPSIVPSTDNPMSTGKAKPKRQSIGKFLKGNPSFFKSSPGGGGSNGDWQIEIAVPGEKAPTVVVIKDENGAEAQQPLGDMSAEGDSDGKEEGFADGRAQGTADAGRDRGSSGQKGLQGLARFEAAGLRDTSLSHRDGVASPARSSMTVSGAGMEPEFAGGGSEDSVTGGFNAGASDGALDREVAGRSGTGTLVSHEGQEKAQGSTSPTGSEDQGSASPEFPMGSSPMQRPNGSGGIGWASMFGRMTGSEGTPLEEGPDRQSGKVKSAHQVDSNGSMPAVSSSVGSRSPGSGGVLSNGIHKTSNELSSDKNQRVQEAHWIRPPASERSQGSGGVEARSSVDNGIPAGAKESKGTETEEGDCEKKSAAGLDQGRHAISGMVGIQAPVNRNGMQIISSRGVDGVNSEDTDEAQIEEDMGHQSFRSSVGSVAQVLYQERESAAEEGLESAIQTPLVDSSLEDGLPQQVEVLPSQFLRGKLDRSQLQDDREAPPRGRAGSTENGTAKETLAGSGSWRQSPARGRIRSRSSAGRRARGGSLPLDHSEEVPEPGGPSSLDDDSMKPQTGGSDNRMEGGRSEWSYDEAAVLRSIQSARQLHLQKEDSEGTDEGEWRGEPTGGDSRYGAPSGESDGDDGEPVMHDGEHASFGGRLERIEQQQIQLLNMMQAFVSSTQDALGGVEVRLRSLERSVEDMTRELAKWRQPNGPIMGASNAVHSSASFGLSEGHLAGEVSPAPGPRPPQVIYSPHPVHPQKVWDMGRGYSAEVAAGMGTDVGGWGAQQPNVNPSLNQTFSPGMGQVLTNGPVHSHGTVSGMTMGSYLQTYPVGPRVSPPNLATHIVPPQQVVYVAMEQPLGGAAGPITAETVQVLTQPGAMPLLRLAVPSSLAHHTLGGVPAGSISGSAPVSGEHASRPIPGSVEESLVTPSGPAPHSGGLKERNADETPVVELEDQVNPGGSENASFGAKMGGTSKAEHMRQSLDRALQEGNVVVQQHRDQGVSGAREGRDEELRGGEAKLDVRGKSLVETNGTPSPKPPVSFTIAGGGFGSSSKGAAGDRNSNILALSWTNVTELLRVGSVQEAYEEVVKVGDRACLVRLMGRTGPVLEELRQETAVEVLGMLLRLVEHNEHMDYVMPWMRQLAEVAAGPEEGRLQLTPDMQRHTVAVLHANSETHDKNDWIGSMAGQLASQLGASWNV